MRCHGARSNDDNATGIAWDVAKERIGKAEDMGRNCLLLRRINKPLWYPGDSDERDVCLLSTNTQPPESWLPLLLKLSVLSKQVAIGIDSTGGRITQMTKFQLQEPSKGWGGTLRYHELEDRGWEVVEKQVVRPDSGTDTCLHSLLSGALSRNFTTISFGVNKSSFAGASMECTVHPRRYSLNPFFKRPL